MPTRFYWKLGDSGRIELVEQFKVLLMSRVSKVLGVYEVTTGGIDGTPVDPRLIFVAALKARASGVILTHNRPSGDPLTKSKRYGFNERN